MDGAWAVVLFFIFSGLLLCAGRLGYIVGEYHGKMEQIRRFEELRKKREYVEQSATAARARAVKLPRE
jgi:hypothetical protein